MFICDKCHVCTKANEDCHKVVVETRPKIYKTKRVVKKDEGEQEKIVESHGTEIVRELKLCSACFKKHE